MATMTPGSSLRLGSHDGESGANVARASDQSGASGSSVAKPPASTGTLNCKGIAVRGVMSHAAFCCGMSSWWRQIAAARLASRPLMSGELASICYARQTLFENS
jgi:hypothetical protein